MRFVVKTRANLYFEIWPIANLRGARHSFYKLMSIFKMLASKSFKFFFVQIILYRIFL